MKDSEYSLAHELIVETIEIHEISDTTEAPEVSEHTEASYLNPDSDPDLDLENEALLKEIEELMKGEISLDQLKASIDNYCPSVASPKLPLKAPQKPSMELVEVLPFHKSLFITKELNRPLIPTSSLIPKDALSEGLDMEISESKSALSESKSNEQLIRFDEFQNPNTGSQDMDPAAYLQQIGPMEQTGNIHHEDEDTYAENPAYVRSPLPMPSVEILEDLQNKLIKSDECQSADIGSQPANMHSGNTNMQHEDEELREGDSTPLRSPLPTVQPTMKVDTEEEITCAEIYADVEEGLGNLSHTEQDLKNDELSNILSPSSTPRVTLIPKVNSPFIRKDKFTGKINSNKFLGQSLNRDLRYKTRGEYDSKEYRYNTKDLDLFLKRLNDF